MPFLHSRSGGRIWYEQQGRGRPLLFIHGWCMSGEVWQLQRQAIADHYSMVTFDLRGHGRSSVPDGGIGGFDGYAADLVELVEFLDLQDMLVVGWSLGGQVLLKAFAELQARLSGLVLVGVTPRFTSAPQFPYGLSANEAEGMRLKVRRNLERALAGFQRQLFVAGELGDPDQAALAHSVLSEVVPPTVAAALDGLEALMTVEMLQEARRISCPVLLLHGDQDPICLPQASTWLNQTIPGSQCLFYPGCGHAPFLSRPEQFNKDLLQFAGGLQDGC